MTDRPETGKPAPENPKKETEEHPLSLLLFAPLRGEAAATTILWGLAGVCIGLAIMGFFVKPGYHFPAESIPVFYGVFGAAAFTLAVLSGWPLGKWLRRPEDFYQSIRKPKDTGEKTGEAKHDA